jgi:fatty-acyl-CoA synthase
MHGLMMDYPLTLTHLLERSAKLFPAKEIASKMPDGMHRYTYAEFHARVHALARGLEQLGIRPGDRIGTLCWNSFRHLELYFAIPCFGAVMHTLNLRLPADQLAYIINHAEDRVIFVDASLASILEPIRDQITCTTQFVLLPDLGNCQSALAPSIDYEQLVQAAIGTSFAWPELDEKTAAATCYTSGTTGNPKGVLYTHRALVLHTFALAMADVFAISERDTILQIVPMFHANGWGIPFAGVMTGARMVFTGRHVQPADIVNLIQNERVTFTAGVPTIWMSLYGYLETQPRDLSSLRTVVVAASAMPRHFIELYEQKYGVHFRLAWGMTETTPIATFMAVKHHLEDLPSKKRFDLLARHGLPIAGVDIRIVDSEGKEIAWDGVTMGELQTRGPWVTSGYYNDPRNDQAFQDGWFRTGDVATIDSEGYLQIMDRTKDLV